MRQLKTLCALLLIGTMMLCALVSCGGDPADTTTVPGTPPEGALINNIEEYKIYYPTDMDSDMFEAVKAFSRVAKEKTGINFLFMEDLSYQIPVGTLEILIGDTNRPESASVRVGLNDYAIYFENNRLCINGGSAEALMTAVTLYFEHYEKDGALYYPQSAFLYRADYPYDSITLDGVDISEYSIVYESSEKNMALLLREQIAKAAGVRLPLRTAKDAVTDKEIVVGLFASGARQAPAAQKGKCHLSKVGSRVFLHGDGEGGTYSAVMTFIDSLVGSGARLSLSTGKTYALLPTINQPNNTPEFDDFRDDLSTLEMSAETVFERFMLAKEELPDEMTVYDRVNIDDFPLSREHVLYVSPQGNDGAAGTKEAPLASLAKAIDKIGNRGGVIYMMGGTYSLSQTVALKKENGGSPTAPLFIKAYNDEDVTLTSNKILENYDSGVWRPVDFTRDKVAARMPEEAKDSGRIYSASLQDLGVTPADMAEISRSSGGAKLYIGDENYTLARFPNATDSSLDEFYFTYTYDCGSVTSPTSGHLSDWLKRVAASGGTLTSNSVIGWQIRVINAKDNDQMKNAKGECNAQEMADEILSWVNTGNIWIYGSTYQGWETGYYNLSLDEESIDNFHYAPDGKTRLLGGFVEDPNGIPTVLYDSKGNAKAATGYYFLKSKHPNSSGCGPSSNSAAGRNTFYFFNAIEAIDVPGEWFYDVETETVYLYATDAFLEGDDITYSGNGSFALLTASKVNGLVIDGIDVNGAGSYGMSFTDCNGIIIQNVKMKNTANNAILMSNSENFRILYSEFSHIYTGRMLSLATNSSAEMTSYDLRVTNNAVQNCVFYDPILNCDTAIFHGGSRMVISHNYFKDTVIKSGNSSEVIIEYNNFEGGSRTMTDGGMIYFSTLTTRGAHVRYNLCHKFNASHRAVYFDTQTSGCYAYGNIISTLDGITETAYNAWYSSTGNGNVCYGNIFLLRNPWQCKLAGITGGDEPGVESQAGTGDTILQSALFYYYWSDTGFSLTANPQHYGYSYKDVKAAGLLDSNDDMAFLRAGLSATGSFKQDEAGGWWLDHAREEVTRYLSTFSAEAWERRFPDYINSLESMKLIIEAYENSDYHVRYFYFPAELSGESYTFETKEDAVFTIPTYQYKDGSKIKTVRQEVRYAEYDDENDKWFVTLSFEEIAAIEKMERAPCNAVIKDNIILGGTPARVGSDGAAIGNAVSETNTITTWNKSGFSTRESTMIDNNFMYFTYADIIPDADLHDYTIHDDIWDTIEETMGEGYRDIFAVTDQYKCGVTYPGFDPTKYE